MEAVRAVAALGFRVAAAGSVFLAAVWDSPAAGGRAADILAAVAITAGAND